MANPVHTPSAHDIAPSIPAQSPAYFKGPFVFYGREYFIITFTTTPEAIARALPAPLQPVGDNKVLFEFMNMHDAPGLGSYSEAGVVIPALLHGEPVNYTAQMYLDCEPPVYGGREIWGFPKKRGKPVLKAVEDTLVGTLEYEGEQIAFGTMPYKAIPIMARHDRDPAKLAMLTKKLSKPAINLKIIPNADGSDCIRQLVQYQCQVINVLEAWEGPARLHLVPHIDALVADFPVLEYHGATHTIADIILPYGHVVHDYLKPGNDSMVTPGSFGTAASLPDRPPMRIDHTPKTVPSIPMQCPVYKMEAAFTFYKRQHFTLVCKSTPQAVRNALPQPLQPHPESLVHFSFMTMLDSPALGSYTEFAVAIPATMPDGTKVLYNNQMYVNAAAPAYGGREIWGLPMKRGDCKLEAREDTLTGTFSYCGQRVAFGTMPYKPTALMAKHEWSKQREDEIIRKLLSHPHVNYKVVPHVDGTDAVRQLVMYEPQIHKVHEAWTGTARIHLVPHVNAPAADFPVVDVLHGIHLEVDMVLPFGRVVHDFMAPAGAEATSSNNAAEC